MLYIFMPSIFLGNCCHVHCLDTLLEGSEIHSMKLVLYDTGVGFVEDCPTLANLRNDRGFISKK